MLNIYSAPSIFAGIISGVLALVIFSFGNKSRSTVLFSTTSLLFSVWSLMLAFNVSSSIETAVPFTFRFIYFVGSLIAANFLIFCISYPNDKKVNRSFLIILGFAMLILFFLFSFTELIISKPITIANSTFVGWEFGPMRLLFHTSFIACWLAGIILLYKKFRGTLDKNYRKNLILIMAALIMGITPPFLFSILLPDIGIFSLNWISPLSGLIWISIIGYSIIKYHLFNIKLITVQLVTFSFWIFMLIRIFFAETRQELLIEVGILLISIILGITLIKTILHEIKQRTRIEGLVGDLKKAYASLKDLNDHLEQKVEEQTHEVRASYEVEKKARQELIKLNETKNHFIGMAQHQLRTPVTGVKWQLEAILADLDKKNPEEVREELEDLSNSVKVLTSTINKITDIKEA